MDSVYDYKYRINLDFDTLEALKRICKEIEVFGGDRFYLEDFKNLIDKPIKIKIDKAKKQLAAEKAREKRKQEAREKVKNAINLLMLESKKITAYSVAKTAGISYNTARKHLKIIHLSQKL